MRRAAFATVTALALLLAGCATPPPDDGRREATLPPTPSIAPPVKLATKPPLRTEWTFGVDPSGTCVATASAAGAALRVTVPNDAPISLSLTMTRAAVLPPTIPVRFSGPAGRWQAIAHTAAGQRVNVTLPSDSDSLSRVLMLLGGGTLQFGRPDAIIVTLTISNADSQAQDWFDRARANVL